MLPPTSYRLLNPVTAERGRTPHDIPPVITREPRWRLLRALRPRRRGRPGAR